MKKGKSVCRCIQMDERKRNDIEKEVNEMKRVGKSTVKEDRRVSNIDL